jgi:hypothetical protein
LTNCLLKSGWMRGYNANPSLLGLGEPKKGGLLCHSIHK